VLDTRIAMRDPMNCIFTYKAQHRTESFRMGRDVFWHLSETFYVNRSDNEMDVSRVLGLDPLRTAVSTEIRSKGMIIKKVQEEEDNK
jgi:hypothetical protein